MSKQPSKASVDSGPIGRYRDFNTSRPPYDQLQSIQQALLRRQKPTWTAQLVLADVCLDLAMERYRPEHIEAARAQLNTVIDEIEATDNVQSFSEQAHHFVAAHLRRAELPAWELAAQGKTPILDYEDLVQASLEVADLGSYHPVAHARIVGHLPLLLGLRGIARNGQIGWLGRLSLERERKFPFQKPIRTNWQAGICQPAPPDSLDFSPEHFINPPIRTRAKTTRKQPYTFAHHRHRYEMGGVVVINAIEDGLGEPRNIIASCAEELSGGGYHFAPDETPLSPSQLDQITLNLAATIQEGRQRILALHQSTE